MLMGMVHYLLQACLLSNPIKLLLSPGIHFHLILSLQQPPLLSSMEGQQIDGRGPSIWDHIAHNYPEKILDSLTVMSPQDFYHRYKEDIKLMKSYGLDAFRLSISWSRIVPSGKVSKGVNKKGIEFYNNVINELISNGIKPFVTIFHADAPQALQAEYGGYASPRIVNDYLDYADICFKEFGDRVKRWATYNEPFVYSKYWFEQNIIVGDLAKDPYLTAHHLLLSHAKAVQLYRKKYKTQNGQIGIVINTDWMVPYSNSKEDIQATQRAQDFKLGWFMDPLTKGEYPKVMQNIIGSRLPKFTVEEAAMVKGSYDYLGLNYYTGSYVKNVPSKSIEVNNVITDPHANQTFERDGELIGDPTGLHGFYVYPEGLGHLLVYMKKTYSNPTIYITENGMPDSNKAPYEQLINDHQRVDFLHRHLIVVKDAITRDRVNVKGYFAWSFMDNWEWNQGFTVRFGLTFIDYKNDLKRIPKLSAKWLKAFLKGYK
ncbi:hypothetical protein Leryth_025710 [Lithospermum erythrorhizon]|nr:hypothetical protein Leryth_025710 [Lithospermum erythrorhizon]